MNRDICLDTGFITLFYSKTPPIEISNLMNEVKQKKIKAYVVWPILIEVYKQLCILEGKVFAESTITSFINNYPVILVNFDISLVLKAGALKCQYRRTLSYNDCIVIAYSLNKKLTLHTTEKDIPKIPNFIMKTYTFQ
ncbi:MAG TPA: hypothetical protein VMV49_14530 [Candidatus Deferrimicrobium sp.]|nr:hypothetical protein [Candidatus Deferrimicrobium sp.]